MERTSDQSVRVGVIGLGFMGATHVAAYQAAARDGFPCELVAVADPKEGRRRGDLSDVGANIPGAARRLTPAFDTSRVRAYERTADLIADESIDLVSICTRTDTHVELAQSALAAAKHVLVEKPVALRAGAIRELAGAADIAQRICMPAMCMRFWPGWTWLKESIDSRRYGSCLSVTFHRLASPPTWSRQFYGDGSVSGGAIVDLHVHDADFVRWCFGEADAVSSAGRIGDSGAVDHVTTLYHYQRGNGPAHVVAEGGWDYSPGFAFTMRYVAIFEGATATFDLARYPPLLLARNGTCEPVPLEATTGYDGEVRHIVSAVASAASGASVTLEDAARVAELLDAERRSAEKRETVPLPGKDH